MAAFAMNYFCTISSLFCNLQAFCKTENKIPYKEKKMKIFKGKSRKLERIKFKILTLLRAETSDPKSMRRSKYDVRLFMTAYINGVIPVIYNCESS